MSERHFIELHRVSKFYANHENISAGFSKVDLSLDIGEFVAITGESGSGKSTLLNVISGLDSYEEGEMFVAGEDTSAFRMEDYERYRKTYIGNIFQDFNLVNSYTVAQNVELAMLLSGRKQADCKARAAELLESVGLSEYARTKAAKLSGGQKQRVAIARALAKDAPIIVADEPTGNLDTASAAKVIETLYRISADRLVIIVTHNYEQVEPYATRKITMHDGRILEDRRLTPSVEREKPAAAETAEFTEVFSVSEPASAEEIIDSEEAKKAASHSEPAPSNEDSLDIDAYLSGESDRRSTRIPRGSRTARHEKEYAESFLERHQEEKAKKELKRETEKGPLRREKTRSQAAAELSDASGEMGFASELRLGLRNAFNIPSKFLLLFLVYTFVACAIILQYASSGMSQYQNMIGGMTSYFSTYDNGRIILRKEDDSLFTEEDMDRIASVEGVDYVVPSDILLDDLCYPMHDAYTLEAGAFFPLDTLKETKATYGRLPENDNEVLIYAAKDNVSVAELQNIGEELIGQSFEFRSMKNNCDLVGKKLTVSGIVLSQEENLGSDPLHLRFYVSDSLIAQAAKKEVAVSSDMTADYGKTAVDYPSSSDLIVVPTDRVERGTVLISDQNTMNFENANWRNRSITLNISNRFYESSVTLKAAEPFTKKNIESVLGYKSEEFDQYSYYYYVNPADFNTLYQRGNYQISVYAEDPLEAGNLETTFTEEGYHALSISNSSSAVQDAANAVMRFFNRIKLVVEFVVLFFIAYAVIRLIMRSRNPYYSTLRILGANRKSMDRILKIELVVMMAISYAFSVGLSVLVRLGVLNVPFAGSMLSFFTPLDYVILGVLLLIMSALIARRYSRRIFGKSAMKVYREEA